MPKSQRLSLEEIRSIWRLLGECRELGADRQAWSQHFVEGMCQLLRSQIGICHETMLTPNGAMEPLSSADTGWATAADREYFVHMLRNLEEMESSLRQVVSILLKKATCRRDEVARDIEYYRSSLYQDYFRPTRLDPYLVCGKLTLRGEFHYGCFQRALGDRPFGEREKTLLQLAHEELVPLIGTALASVHEPRLADLTPRQRQTLAHLLEGDSEKQVAARLGVGVATVHTYVKALYRHYHVAGRAELLVWFLRRAYPQELLLTWSLTPRSAQGPARFS